MSELRNRVAVGIGVAGVVWGLAAALAPPARDVDTGRSRPGQSSAAQDTGDLSDADERSKSRMRDSGNDLVDAENDQSLKPGERRPPERPRVRIRIR